MALERVKELGLSRNIKENKNSFQAIINTYKATEEIAGILNGIIILEIIPNQLSLSNIAASSNSLGILLKYPWSMLQGYFKSIPKELEEAAILDKLSWFGIISKIIIPLSIPAISSVALYVFMIAWNEFLFSLMFLDNPNSFTLSRAIQYLSGDAETPRQYLMAGSVIVTLPVLFIFVYFEKYLVSGLTAGSVKG